MQAQTFAHSYAAIEAGLDIIPVINKVDSIDVDVENVTKQIFNLIGARDEEIFKISAKSGLGVDDLIKEIPEFNKLSSNKSRKYECANLRFLLRSL